MKLKILTIYYSQTGQLKRVLDSVIDGIDHRAEIHYAVIEPVQPFPFPWPSSDFFDAMPDIIENTAVEINPLPVEIMDTDYDLILLGYQPWFLNPSTPITSFLKSRYTAVLHNKPVVTVVAGGNLWLHAQEQIKEHLHALNARHVGHIALTGRNRGLHAVIASYGWATTGRKEVHPRLPATAGIKDEDIHAAQRFGNAIYQHLSGNNLIDLQRSLLARGAVNISAGQILLEQRLIKRLRFLSALIRKRGPSGSPERIKQINTIKAALLPCLFIASPVLSLFVRLKGTIQKYALLKDIEYFKQLEYKEGLYK